MNSHLHASTKHNWDKACSKCFRPRPAEVETPTWLDTNHLREANAVGADGLATWVGLHLAVALGSDVYRFFSLFFFQSDETSSCRGNCSGSIVSCASISSVQLLMRSTDTCKIKGSKGGWKLHLCISKAVGQLTRGWRWRWRRHSHRRRNVKSLVTFPFMRFIKWLNMQDLNISLNMR